MLLQYDREERYEKGWAQPLIKVAASPHKSARPIRCRPLHPGGHDCRRFPAAAGLRVEKCVCYHRYRVTGIGDAFETSGACNEHGFPARYGRGFSSGSLMVSFLLCVEFH